MAARAHHKLAYLFLPAVVESENSRRELDHKKQPASASVIGVFSGRPAGFRTSPGLIATGSTGVAPSSRESGFRETSLEAAYLLNILVSAVGIEPTTY